MKALSRVVGTNPYEMLWEQPESGEGSAHIGGVRSRPLIKLLMMVLIMMMTRMMVMSVR